MPAPVICRLTPYGATVLQVVKRVRLWGAAHPEGTHGQAATTGCVRPVGRLAKPRSARTPTWQVRFF